MATKTTQTKAQWRDMLHLRRTLSFLTDGKIDRKSGALTGLALNRNGAAVFQHDSVDNRQSQPGSFPEFLGRKEGVKDLEEVFFGNATASIGDDHSHCLIGWCHANA